MRGHRGNSTRRSRPSAATSSTYQLSPRSMFDRSAHASPTVSAPIAAARATRAAGRRRPVASGRGVLARLARTASHRAARRTSALSAARMTSCQPRARVGHVSTPQWIGRTVGRRRRATRAATRALQIARARSGGAPSPAGPRSAIARPIGHQERSPGERARLVQRALDSSAASVRPTPAVSAASRRRRSAPGRRASRSTERRS